MATDMWVPFRRGNVERKRICVALADVAIVPAKWGRASTQRLSRRFALPSGGAVLMS